MGDDDGTTAAWHDQQVRQAIEDCWDALDEFDMERMYAADVRNRNPKADEDVQTSKIALHVTVMRLFRRIRPQINNHLSPDYWKDVDVYRDPETGRCLIRGLGSLEDYQARVREEIRMTEQRHATDREVTEWSAELLPARAYRRIVNLLAGACTELGYFQAPDPPRANYHIEAYPDGMPGRPDYEAPEGYDPEDPNPEEEPDEPHPATPAVRRAMENADEEVTAGGD